jgi:hypothetical protein
VCTPRLWCGGEDTLAGWREGWGVNILEDVRHSSVLYVCKYFVAYNKKAKKLKNKLIPLTSTILTLTKANQSQPVTFRPIYSGAREKCQKFNLLCDGIEKKCQMRLRSALKRMRIQNTCYSKIRRYSFEMPDPGVNNLKLHINFEKTGHLKTFSSLKVFTFSAKCGILLLGIQIRIQNL